MNDAIKEALLKGAERDLRSRASEEPPTLGAYIFTAIVTSLLTWVLLPIAPFTTTAGGIVGTITFGIGDAIISLVGAPIRILLLGTSRLWIAVPLSRPLVLLPGIVLACMATIYVSLTPSYGDKTAKLLSLTVAGLWPLSALVEPAFQQAVDDHARFEDTIRG